MRLSKPLAGIILISVFVSLEPQKAAAQNGLVESGSLGIGLMIGEPTGASVKYWNSNATAFNIGAAWSLAGRSEALHIHTDFLWHSWFPDPQNLAFYYGIGGRIIFASEANAGLRFPFGLNYVFKDIPFDLFVEAVPIIDLTPEIEFAGNGAVGIRYYF